MSRLRLNLHSLFHEMEGPGVNTSCQADLAWCTRVRDRFGRFGQESAVRAHSWIFTEVGENAKSETHTPNP